MIVRVVKMKFRLDGCDTFESIFDLNKEDIRASQGCHHLELLRDVADPTVYFTYSIWNSSEDLDRYRNSTLFQETWAKTKALFDGKPQAHSLQKLQILP